MLARIQPQVAGNVGNRDRNQQVVNVVASQMGVAIGGDDFENSVLQFQDRNIERTAAKVVHRDGSVLFPVQPIGKRCRRGLVHQPQHLQPRNASRVLGCLPLGVVEVRRNGDHRLLHRRPEEAFRIAFELAQNLRGNLRRRVAALTQLDAQHFPRRKVFGETERKQLEFLLHVVHAPSHQPLHAVNGALRVRQQRLARGIAHQHVVVAVQRHHRWNQVRAIFPGNNKHALARFVRMRKRGPGAHVGHQ